MQAVDNGRTIFTAQNDGTVMRWSWNGKKGDPAVPQYPRPWTALNVPGTYESETAWNDFWFSADLTCAATFIGPNAAPRPILWQVPDVDAQSNAPRAAPSAQLLPELHLAGDEQVTAVGLRPGLLAVISDHGHLWFLADGTWTPDPDGRTFGNSVTAIGLSQDGQRIAVGTDDGTVEIRNAGRRETRYGHTATVTAVAFHPTDPGILVTGSSDGTARVWLTSQ